MPEGDTIYRSAQVLRPAMEGGVISSAHLRDSLFDPERIIGQTVACVEARGKHLLMHLSSRCAVHSHMGMTGSWHIYRPGEPWRKPLRYAVLQLEIRDLAVICFSPKLLELLTDDQLKRHPHLRRLGPDLLAPHFDARAAAERFSSRRDLSLGEAVMDQTIVCGIGNVYKSEILFLLGFDPFAPVNMYSNDELQALVETARRLMRRNLSGHVRQTRFRGEGRRLWVYGRSGEACCKCGTALQLSRQGDAGRTTCWCPTCQPSRI